MIGRAIGIVGLVALVAAAVAACDDPVHDSQVDALGPETPGIPRGPLHRAGQPCLTCHDGSGPGSPEFRIAGTVYAGREVSQVVPNATVHIEDSKGQSIEALTNEAGNFFILKTSWDPVFPLQNITVTSDTIQASMGTRVGRDGSCASCHVAPVAPNSPGKVFVPVDTAPSAAAGGNP